MSQVLSSIVGFTRMGPNRELKKRIEAFWKEPSTTENTAQFIKDIDQLQVQRWEQLKATELDLIPSNDYSLYDQLLDTAFLFNAIPKRYRELEKEPGVRTYFAMARGLQENGVDVAALPMKKWFDTNYHFIVPELSADQQFSIGTSKPLHDFILAKTKLNLITKPVLQGPITFLHFSHVLNEDKQVNHLKLLNGLLQEYVKVIHSLVEAGAKWIQIDEPAFVLNFGSDAQAYHNAFKQSAKVLQDAAGPNVHLIFTTYFNSIVSSGNLQIVKDLPEGSAIHVDLVRSPEQLEPVLNALPSKSIISLGLVDGRNIWLTPLQKSHDVLHEVVKKLGANRVLVGTSCSLLHVPFSVKSEPAGYGADSSKVLPWLSFGIEKIRDVVVLAKSADFKDCQSSRITTAIKENSELLKDHSVSPIIHNAEVKKRVAEIEKQGVQSLFRQSPHSKRSVIQQDKLKLPLIPTTTIGSFPQSAEVRGERAKFRAGRISQKEYDAFINAETERCVRIQEEIGLDVLVHGEFERNDMVEFFGEHLRGFHATSNGWVQSYGTRCVKPAIIYGDIQRPSPMTVDMIKYAQSLTKKPMKGMLTGPTTILKWSFVRNDQPYRDTVFQMALALRDEVHDLDKAGITAIQVDEPAFREGLPLDDSQHAEYLKTTVEAFKISTGFVADSTQIYTHMCYSYFEDIFTHIAELDADVICIECSRSELSLLSCFNKFGYPLNVGPGLYDIHSPRVPSKEEFKARLLAMAKTIPPSRLFANPDCGLKTRGWVEVKAALKNMVEAVKEVRKHVEEQ